MLTRRAAAGRILSGMRSPARRAWLPTATCGLLAALAVAGCGPHKTASQQTAATGPTTQAAPASTLPPPSPTPSPAPSCSTTVAAGFPCAMRERIVAARHYANHLPGTIGIVLHDRATGATWHNAHAGTLQPAASTIKLAMMTDILQRQRAGQFQLTPADRAAMFEALYTSNDDDATYLWNRYENASFMDRVRAFGMKNTQFTNAAFWGDVDTTARDLDSLMNYVLDKAPPHIRGYLVHRLQHVAALDQQWGVWGAGPENQPGNKDGWEYDPPWITNTVGFAGPHQEYTLAIMYNLEGYGDAGDVGFNYGINTLTQIASILFQGHQTQQPTAQASAVP